jgi:hypothetical protein
MNARVVAAIWTVEVWVNQKVPSAEVTRLSTTVQRTPHRSTITLAGNCIAM